MTDFPPRRRGPAPWLALALLPTNSVLARLDVANERQLYLAAIPLYALVGMLWSRAWMGSRRHARVITALLTGILLAATVMRNLVYASETAFWQAAVRADGGNARAWNNLGFALEREQPLAADAALDAYQRFFDFLVSSGIGAAHKAFSTGTEGGTGYQGYILFLQQAVGKGVVIQTGDADLGEGVEGALGLKGG